VSLTQVIVKFTEILLFQYSHPKLPPPPLSAGITGMNHHTGIACLFVCFVLFCFFKIDFPCSSCPRTYFVSRLQLTRDPPASAFIQNAGIKKQNKTKQKRKPIKQSKQTTRQKWCTHLILALHRQRQVDL